MSIFFYIDIDAFFSKVEQIENPQLLNKPVIVGGDLNRGVVSTCSYEARKFGVKSAMSIFQAKKLCPDAIFLPTNLPLYCKYSKIVMDILDRWAPEFEQISIDEACLNMSNTKFIYNDIIETAKKIKREIFDNTGLTVSLGIAQNKLIAKMASDCNKPDGLTVINSGEEENFVATLPLKKIWGIGKATIQKLNGAHIFTVEEAKNFSQNYINKLLGNALGDFFYSAIRGIDNRIFNLQPLKKSISNEITLSKDTIDINYIQQILFNLTYSIMYRLCDDKKKSKSLFLKIKYYNFESTTIQTTIDHSFFNGQEVYETLMMLLKKKWNFKTPIRLLGAGFSNVEDTSISEQGNLFTESEEKKGKVEKVAFFLKQKGYKIDKASIQNKNDIKNN